MTLRYVYAIAPATSSSGIEAAALVGIDESRVRAIPERDLAAIASDLPEEEWRDEVLNERIGDLDWLAPRAAAHQEVNARALELTGALIPLAFGALYRGDERVREMLREDHDAKARKLAELRGKAEWVVTVTRGAADVPGMTADLAALDREIASSDPGRAYLLEKRRTTVASAAAERADDDAARRAFDVLATVSERTYREPVARGGPDVVALRVSLLAPRSDPSVPRAIAHITGELGQNGYRVRATGPWPAYRFGSLP
jgi:gas vesicle protein GvpL/GvpF